MRHPRHCIAHFGVATLLATLLACGGGSSGSTPSTDAQAALDLAPAATETAEITGTVATPTATTQSVGTSAAAGIDVAAVDEHGNKQAEQLGVTSTFRLAVPTGHDYALLFSEGGRIISTLVYRGADGSDQSDIAVPHGTTRVDLGTIIVDRAAQRVVVQDPSRVPESTTPRIPMVDVDGDHIPDSIDPSIDIPAGDPAVGAARFAASCIGCHGADGSGGAVVPDSIRGASSDEVAAVLANGNTNGMPAFPDLVAYAADIAAFLGDTGTGSGSGSGSPTDGGGDSGTGGGGATPGTTTGADAYGAHCASCHGADGSGTAIAPEITGASAGEIADALGEVGAMASVSVTADEINAIAAFLSGNGATVGGDDEGDGGDSEADGDDDDATPSAPETATITGTVDILALITGDVEVHSVTTQSIDPAELPHGVAITAVDESGATQAEAQGVADGFSLTVPTGHTYELVVSDDEGVIGTMTYPDGRGGSATAIEIGGGTTTVEVGQITVNGADGTVAAATAPVYDTGVPTPAPTPTPTPTPVPDPAAGQAVYAASCTGCHGANATGGFGPNIVGASQAVVSNVLANGKGVMPAFPALVGNAADIAAYLATL